MKAKLILNIVLVVALLVVFYMLFINAKKIFIRKPVVSNGTSSGGTSSTNTKKVGSCGTHDPLKLVRYRDTGCEVKHIQCKLNNFHGENLVVDGILGDNTLTALTRNGYSLPISSSSVARPLVSYSCE